MSNIEVMDEETKPEPKWKPIPALQRRILGVLGEKAKTTPSAYPLSLNALVTGCNQKSNRYPQMTVEAYDVENELEKLRAMGAVSEVQGDGRVARYRHYLYEWLGVDKVEVAVMIELLLRGAQTVGELRGRAARMEPISGVAELKPILQGLIDRKLVVSLTPEGRGQIVSHTLYLETEWDKVKRNLPVGGSESSPSVSPKPTKSSSDNQGLRAEVQQLKDEVAELRAAVEELKAR